MPGRPNTSSTFRKPRNRLLTLCCLLHKSLARPTILRVVQIQPTNKHLSALLPTHQHTGTSHQDISTSQPSYPNPSTMSQQAPRQRLSLYTHRTLSHDVAAALKASSPLRIQTANLHFEPTPAPPPSPVDFGSFSSEFSSASEASEWLVRSPESSNQAVTA